MRIVLRLSTPFCFTDHKLENVGPLLVDYLDMRSLCYCSFNSNILKSIRNYSSSNQDRGDEGSADEVEKQEEYIDDC